MGFTVIEVFDDRVEISNLGGLVSAIPEIDFGKRSHSRNPLIFGLFAKMHLVEQVGSGVSRIKDLMKEAGLKPPVFGKEGFFSVTFLRPADTAKLSQKPSQKTKDKVLFYINQNPKITIAELSQLLHKSRRTIELHLKLLKDNRLIEQTESGIIAPNTTEIAVPDTGQLSANTGQLSVDTGQLSADTSLSLEEKIMFYLQQNESITIKDVMELLDLKRSRTKEKLKEMTDKGFLEKRGNTKSTYYTKKTQ